MKKYVYLILAAMSAGAAAPPSTILEEGNATLLAALTKNHILVPGRRLLFAGYICSVTVASEELPVVELIEQEPEATEPRGIARVVLLTPSLEPIKEIPEFGGVRPLLCKANSLYFSGIVKIDNIAPGGNRVTFMLGGDYAQVDEVDPRDFPAAPEH